MSSPPSRNPFAPPWRRLLAHIIDVCCIVALAGCGYGLAALTGWQALAASMPVLMAVTTPLLIVLCWWRWGATPGKFYLGMRICGAGGRRPTLRQAVLRYLGFVLAALPLKLGFLGVVTHPRRRGWHDVLADTDVLMEGGVAAAELEPTPTKILAGPTPRFIDITGVTAAYTLLVLLITWPGLALPATHRPGGPGDGSAFMWCFWWLRHAITHHLSPLHTDWLFWPVGIPLTFHTMNWLHTTVGALALGLLSPTQVYCLVFAGSLIANGVAAYWLAVRLTGSRVGAALAGGGFCVAPYFLSHGLGHLNLLAFEFVPLLLLAALHWAETRAVRWAVATTVLLSLVGLCDWYYFVFGVLALVLVALWSWQVRLPGRCRIAGGLAIAALLSAVILAPLLVPAWRIRRQSTFMDQPIGRARLYSVDLVAAAAPNPFHPLWGKMARGIHERLSFASTEAVVFPGMLMILLGLLGYCRLRRRRAAVASLLAVLIAVPSALSLGPNLRVNGVERWPLAALLYAGGLPGNGFDAPLSADLACWLARSVVSPHSGNALSPWSPMPVHPPYWLEWKLLPPLRALSAPARFAVVALMALAVLAAAGVESVLERLRSGPTSAARLAAAAIGAGLVFECWSVPYPTTPTTPPAFYQRLAREPGDFAIIDVPLHDEIREWQAYQTVHEKRLFCGHASRLPDAAFRFIRDNALLSAVWWTQDRFGPTTALGARDETWLADADNRQRLRSALQSLIENRARYLVIHQAWLQDVDRARMRVMMEEVLSCPRVSEGEGLTVYRLDTPPNGRP